MKSEFNLRLPQAFIIYLLLLLDQLNSSYGNNLNCVKTPTRPFYLIGHMCNSIDEVKQFVMSGANSVEVDIQFTEDGLLEMVYHGLPCDCFRYCSSREDIDTMFEYLRDISTPGNSEYQPHFTLVLFDLKIKRLSEKAKVTAGLMMADKLINILFESEQGLSKLRIVLGLEMIADYHFVYALVDRFNQRNFPSLLDRIGFDVSGNENIDNIEYLWRFMFENKMNVWQGDGITNCLSYIRPNQRIKELIKLRDGNLTESYAAKIYHWTIDSKYTIKDSLRLGVDGMITNEVSNIVDALNDDEFRSQYHLANNDDDPFCTIKSYQLKALRQNYRELNKHKLINNLMITNYVMQSNEQPAVTLTTSQTMKPFLQTAHNNFESDNLIRTGNDFKRNSFSDFNFKQLITQLLAFLQKRSPYKYDNLMMRFNVLGRSSSDQTIYNGRIDSRDFQNRAALF